MARRVLHDDAVKTPVPRIITQARLWTTRPTFAERFPDMGLFVKGRSYVRGRTGLPAVFEYSPGVERFEQFVASHRSLMRADVSTPRRPQPARLGGRHS